MAADTPDFRVVAGSPTEEELAAVTAVIMQAAAEQQFLAAAASESKPAQPSAWTRSQRKGRYPLGPGSGSWGTFGR